LPASCREPSCDATGFDGTPRIASKPSATVLERTIVVRFDGTNAQEGREILAEAAPSNLTVEPTMLDAARRAVELAEIG
jgi:succinyl-CoA synthetase beta subunit